jgi:hypothetical protein
VNRDGRPSLFIMNSILPIRSGRRTLRTDFDGAYRRIQFTSPNTHIITYTFFDEVLPTMLDTMNILLIEPGNFKIRPTLKLIVFHKLEDEEVDEPIYLSINATPLKEEFIQEMGSIFAAKLEEHTIDGSSSWRLKTVEFLDWYVVRYQTIPTDEGQCKVKLPPGLPSKKTKLPPKLASKKVKLAPKHSNRKAQLPSKLSTKKAVVNVDVHKNYSFKYAVLSVLHYGDLQRFQRHRAAQYTPWINELNFAGITFPFKTSSLSIFERNNPSLSICLFQWKNDKARLLQWNSSSPDRRVVHVLLVEDYYVGVTNLDRLINFDSRHKYYNCPQCLQPSTTVKKLEEHLVFCNQNDAQQFIIPIENKFKLSNHIISTPPNLKQSSFCVDDLL